MRRISLSAIILIVVVCWQACTTPTQSHPVAGRRDVAPEQTSSARRRDGLLVGSDFLDMFIGSPAGTSSTRGRRYPPLHRPRDDQDVRDNLTDDLDSNDRLSGLIRTRDRASSYGPYQRQQADDDGQRGSRKFTKSPLESDVGVGDDETSGAERMIDENVDVDQLFGARTAPRAGAATVTADSSRVPVFNVPVLQKFSVSSSVQKITSRSRPNIRNTHSQTTPNPVTYSDVFPSTSQDSITEEISPDVESSTSSVDVEYTSNGVAQSTVSEDTTVTSLADIKSTEAVEDWSTKSDISTEGTTLPDDGDLTVDHTQTPLYSETPVQVVSVRVSSSVAQTPVTSRPKPDENHATSSNILTSSEEYLNDAAGSLEIADRPPATSIQRSDFSVEESAPSEVTSDPQSAYASFHSYGHSPGSSDPQVSPVSYQTSVTSATSGSRVLFFSKPPNYRRGLSYLRRSSTDVGQSTTPLTSNYRRHIPLHALPRSYVPRGSTSLPQTSRSEPVLVAESIQTSVIANQDGDDEESKDRFDGSRGSKSFQTRESTRKGYRPQERVYAGPEKIYGVPAKVYGEPAKVYGEPAKVYGEPAKVYGEPAKVYGEPAKVYGQQAQVYGEPAKVYGEPAKVYGEPAKVYGEPSKVYGEPSKVYGEPAKSYAEPERNYEVDETVSVGSNGRAHGVQTTPQDATTPSSDGALKVFDTRQQDPNHKFGYVVEGRDFRKYRVEERTSDGFIVGEYGVVSHDGDNLRGVRYTADGTINPRLIYDTLLKFLSL